MDSAHGQDRDDSGVRFPPPLYFVGGFAAGLALERLKPLRQPALAGRRSAGFSLVAAGLLLIGWAIGTMRRAGTSPEPWEPTTAVVSNGPFRFTRNPIYLGDAVVYVGASLLATRSLWPFLLLPIVVLALWRRVIQKEERYLEGKFGEEYRAYKLRVRRWV